MSVGRLETDIIIKYFDTLQPYLQLIAYLRFDRFIYKICNGQKERHTCTDKTRDWDAWSDFVMIKDDRKYNFVKYGIILGF